MAESILGYISRIIFFPNRRLVQERSKKIEIFFIKQIQGNLMTKVFFIFKETLFLAYFWSISPIFGGRKCFPRKSDMHNLIRFSSTMSKFRET